MIRIFNVSFLVSAVVLLMPAMLFGQKDCASLRSVALPHASVLAADLVPAVAATGATPQTPAYCRVKVSATPTADSNIGIEIWMPATDWNGELLQLGNGGLAGSINYPPMLQQIALHYAVAATDDGHTGAATDGTWAMGHPEKVTDFGYRAVHDANVDAKLLIAAFYGHSQRFAYFNGCSEGGREALMEAERFPNDFDGILAGAPRPTGPASWRGLPGTRKPSSKIPQAIFRRRNDQLLKPPRSRPAAQMVASAMLSSMIL